MEHIKRKTSPSAYSGNVTVAQAHKSMLKNGGAKNGVAVTVALSPHDDSMLTTCNVRKNKRKNIPTKTVAANAILKWEELANKPREATVDEDNLSCGSCIEELTDTTCEIDSSASSVKSQSTKPTVEEKSNLYEPMDLSVCNSVHQKQNANKSNEKKANVQPQKQLSEQQQVAHMQQNLLSLAEQMGLRLPSNLSLSLNQPQVSWNNVLKTESLNEWRATLQQIIDHVQMLHCKLTEALTLTNTDHPISHFYITDVQSTVQKLLTELDVDVQKLGQFQYLCESLQPAMHVPRNIDYTKQMAALNMVVQQIGMLQNGDSPAGRSSASTPRHMTPSPKLPLNQFFLSDLTSADGRAASSLNHDVDEPPFKKKKKDPRCQDDEEANYVDPMWEPIIIYKENVEYVKFSHIYDVEMPRSKFEELLMKASSSSTRLLRVLMKHFFTHEQLAAGSLTGEGVYKDKLDENITKAIREIVSKRHPKLKKAKINLCCTDVCVQARRVNENQRRRVTRGGPLQSLSALEFQDDGLDNSLEENMKLENEDDNAYSQMTSRLPNGALDPLDFNNN